MNAPFKRRRWALALIAASTLLASCASPTAADYAAEKPQLDLKTYFNGELVAHGLFTDRSGSRRAAARCGRTRLSGSPGTSSS